MINMDEIVWIFLLFVCILCLILLVVFFLIYKRKDDKRQKENYERFMNLVIHNNQELNKQLLSFSNDLSSYLRDDFERLKNSNDLKMSGLEKRINDSLLNNYLRSDKIFKDLNLNMGKIDHAQNDLKELSKELLDIKKIFYDKKMRGTFGEVELYSILKASYGDDEHFYKKQYKLSNGYIADAVLLTFEPLGKVVIDSKFPLDAYNIMCDETKDAFTKEKARLQFKRDLVKHINDIADKYLIVNETADLAYMFIPSEVIFEEIYAAHSDVVEYSYKKHVYIVSPTTLNAYLTALKAIYLNTQKSEHLKELALEYTKLAKEFERYNDRFAVLSKDFEKIYKDFHDLSITGAKIIKRFKEIDSFEFKRDEDVS